MRGVAVRETFFSVLVNDMERATAFYVAALGAEVIAATPRWTSIRIAGVRVGLFLHPHDPVRVGLHFVVGDLAAAGAAIAGAGGAIEPAVEVAPGVVTADATDTEGNTFSLRA
jgi:predicted enzyme related to lactoylglutathione lyase